MAGARFGPELGLPIWESGLPCAKSSDLNPEPESRCKPKVPKEEHVGVSEVLEGMSARPQVPKHEKAPEGLRFALVPTFLALFVNVF